MLPRMLLSEVKNVKYLSTHNTDYGTLSRHSVTHWLIVDFSRNSEDQSFIFKFVFYLHIVLRALLDESNNS